MWFRIELNKDRSVKSCVAVESSLNEGRSVHYIEADSKAEALHILVGRYDSQRAREKKRLLSLKHGRAEMGLCIECGKEPQTAPGKPGSRCLLCSEKKREARARLGRGERTHRIAAKTDEEKAARMRERRKTKETNRRDRRRHYTSKRAQIFRSVLAAFETMKPAEFRSWLLQKVDESALAAREVAT